MNRPNLPRTSRLIGRLSRCATARPDASGITLQELAALVISAGSEAGFVVQVEVPVRLERRRGKLDCAWLAFADTSGELRMVAAWEFDGQDVGPAHVKGTDTRIGNIRKLKAAKAEIEFQALYSYRNGPLGKPNEATVSALKGVGITVFSDAELLKDGLFTAVAHATQAVSSSRLLLLKKGQQRP